MQDFISTLLPIGGAIAGGVAAGPQGAIIGAGIGQAGASALAMGQEVPEIPGATAAQKQIQAIQLSNLERLQAREGLSAQDVARINQTMNIVAEQQLQALQALPQTLTPLERQRLGKALVSPDGYVLAFELASVLLVAAMIGAIYVAWERRS